MKHFIRISVIFLGVLIILFGTTLVGIKIYNDIQDYLPSLEQVSFSYIEEALETGETVVLYEEQVLDLENAPIIEGDVTYLPVDFVKMYFNDNFFWDENEKILTYTSLKDVIRLKTDELTYFVNDEPLVLNIAIREMKEGVPYMPQDLVMKFSQGTFSYNPDLNLLIVDDLTREAQIGTVMPSIGNEIYLRTGRDKKTPYLRKVVEGEEVKIYDDDGIWLYVRTSEGLLGYMRKKDLGGIVVKGAQPKYVETANYNPNKNFEGKLNLVWHQVFNTTANTFLPERIADAHHLDVLSPTWFSIKDTEGNLSSIADVNYVRTAHAKNMQVWALIDNQFDRALTHEVLSSTAKRQHIIKQLLAYSAIYELDGINVDFENVGKDDGEYFVQFMRELTPYLKNQGLVVSVDMYVPAPWTEHYNRKVMGELVDYVMIMGYDEHWSTSPISGSVASIGFVEKGVVDTLKDVPKEKVVLGLPYYTRLWKEEMVDGAIKVSSSAMGMNKGIQTLKDQGVEAVWLEDIGQYYGEYMIEDVTYKIWLEEARSIEEKMKIVEKYDIAGVAGWKLALEQKEVWDVLYEYLKK